MNKPLVFEQLIATLQTTLDIAIQAANDAHNLATHEQSKPETQYDTVGLEASYLAHGQSQRVSDIKLEIDDWQRLQTRTFNHHSEVAAGALVELEDVDQQAYFYLLGNYSGGTKYKIDDKTITVVSTASPIGMALLSKQIDDQITIGRSPKITLEIVAIY